MKAKALLVVLSVALIPGAGWTQFKANGYFSFQYENGQAWSEFPDGTFEKVQAGLLFSGQSGNIFEYAIEVRFKTETNVEVEEAWVGIFSSPSFHLRLGFYLVPFGKYNQSNRPYETPFIQIPLHLEAIYPASWRDIGVLAEGRTSFFRYSVYLGNGLKETESLLAGQQYQDNNANKAVGGRIGIYLSQSFEVGFSYYRGKYDNAGTRNLELRGADISWNTESFVFLYEYGKALLDNPLGFSRGEAKGHYALLSWKMGEFSPLVSYQTLDYQDSFHGPGWLSEEEIPGEGIFSETSRWALGLAYALSPNIAIKVEYDFNREGKASLANDVFLAQVAVNF